MNSTKTPQQDILQSQTNAEHQDKLNSSELITNEQLQNTPFVIIGNEEHGYFLAMGRYRMTEPMKTKDEVKHYLANNTYNVIATMITTFVQAIQDYKESELQRLTKAVKNINESEKDIWDEYKKATEHLR